MILRIRADMKGKMDSRISVKFLFFTGALLFSFGSWQSVCSQVKPEWKSQWEKVLSAAKEEGKVVIFGPPGDLIRKAVTRGFKKAFRDIAIEYFGGRSGVLATKLRMERNGDVYNVDVFLGGTTTANTQLKPIAAQDPIEPALIRPEVTDLKYWRDRVIEFSDKSTRTNLVFVNQLKVPLIYNLEQVKPDELDQLYEILAPKWKGKIVINDPLPTGAGNVTFRWIWHVLGPERARDYFRKVRAQAGAVGREQRRQIEWIARGKYAAVLGPSDSILHQMLKKGLRFGVLGEFEDYGTLITASYGSVSLINRAPHPNAAKVFINWILSKEGQTAWSKAMDHVSRRTDVSTDHLPSYQQPKPGRKYWLSHREENIRQSEEETKILRELFGR